MVHSVALLASLVCTHFVALTPPSSTYLPTTSIKLWEEATQSMVEEHHESLWSSGNPWPQDMPYIQVPIDTRVGRLHTVHTVTRHGATNQSLSSLTVHSISRPLCVHPNSCKFCMRCACGSWKSIRRFEMHSTRQWRTTPNQCLWYALSSSTRGAQPQGYD